MIGSDLWSDLWSIACPKRALPKWSEFNRTSYHPSIGGSFELIAVYLLTVSDILVDRPDPVIFIYYFGNNWKEGKSIKTHHLQTQQQSFVDQPSFGLTVPKEKSKRDREKESQGEGGETKVFVRLFLVQVQPKEVAARVEKTFLLAWVSIDGCGYKF